MIIRTYKEEKEHAIAFLKNIRNSNFEEGLNIILAIPKKASYIWPEVANRIKLKDIHFLNNFLEFCKSDKLDLIDNVSYSLLKSISHTLSKNYNDALSILLEVDKIQKDNVNVLLFIGIGYMRLENYEQAIEYFNRSIQLESNFIRSYIGLGHIYRTLTHYNLAIEQYNKAIQIDPKYAGAYNGIGNVYFDLKEFIEAINYYNKAIQIDPEFDIAYNHLGNVYLELKEFIQAIDYYNKAIQIDPDNSPTYYHNLGLAYYNLKEYNRAIEYYNKAIQIDPKYVICYNGIGNAYFDLKEIKTAIEYYNKAIQIDSDYSHAYHNLGAAYYNLKEYNRAIDYYKKATEAAPDIYKKKNEIISDCYFKLSKFKEAKEYLEKYLNDFPDNEDAFSKLQKIYKSLKSINEKESGGFSNVFENTFYLINAEKSNDFFLSNVKTFMEKIKIPIVDNLDNAEAVIIIQPYDFISEEYIFQIIHKLEERKIHYQINLMDEEFSLPIKYQSDKDIQSITNIREKLINDYKEKISTFSSFETLQNNIHFFLFNKPTTSLKVLSLELQNIGLFEDATFQFDKKATVFVGLNGTGKTTILRSLGLGLIGSHHDSTPLDSIKSLLDVKQWSQENQKKENGTIKVTCEINSKIIETEIVLSVNEESGKITCSSKGTSYLFNGAFLKVPIIGFGQQRKQFSPTEKKKDFVDVSFPSINDITNLINNKEDDRLHSFVSWIANIQNESQKKGKENKAELIFLAFIIFSEIADEVIQFQELKNIDPLDLWIVTKESPTGIPIEYSSQGFQTIMGWIGYIIERMNEAYPNSKDFKSEPAIVIVDEIDSFLHPKWQQNVLKVLMKTFPNMQIIASSHSPLVIDGLDKNQVLALRYNEKYKKIEAKVNLVDIWAWDYEEILLKLFDVYQIPKEYQAAVVEKMEAIRSKPFQTEIDKKELEDYQRLLDRLEESRIYNNEIEQIKKTLKEKEVQLDRLIEKYEKKV